jgi:hypothetical protein
MAFDQKRAIEDYNELQRRVSVGAYEERSTYHYESGTWPEDGVEESIHNLTELAAKDGLEFCWEVSNGTWVLLPMSDETKAARASASNYKMSDLYEYTLHDETDNTLQVFTAHTMSSTSFSAKQTLDLLNFLAANREQIEALANQLQTKRAQEHQDTQKYIEHFYEGGE